MPNPFDFIHELRDMNAQMVSRLDEIIEQLQTLIDIQTSTKVDWYGDGK